MGQDTRSKGQIRIHSIDGKCCILSLQSSELCYCYIVNGNFCFRYGLRYVAMSLRVALGEKFPEAPESEMIKVNKFCSTFLMHTS